MQPAVLRLLLLRLLLLALFFNSVVGVPAHAISHLTAAQPSSATATAEAEAEAEEEYEAHAACAWCNSYAQLDHLVDAAPQRLQRQSVAAGLANSWCTCEPVPSADRWPFRSRDPPQT